MHAPAGRARVWRHPPAVSLQAVVKPAPRSAHNDRLHRQQRAQPSLQRCGALGMRRRAAPAPQTDDVVAEHVVQPQHPQQQRAQREQQLQRQQYELAPEPGPGPLHNHVQTIWFLAKGGAYALIATPAIALARFIYMQRGLLLPKAPGANLAQGSVSSDTVDSSSMSSTAAMDAIRPSQIGIASSISWGLSGASTTAAANSPAISTRPSAASGRRGLEKGWWRTLPQLHYINFGSKTVVPSIPLKAGKKQQTLVAFEDAADAHFVAQTLLANMLESRDASNAERKLQPNVVPASPTFLLNVAHNQGTPVDVLPRNMLQHSARLDDLELQIVLREALVGAATNAPHGVVQQQRQQPWQQKQHQKPAPSIGGSQDAAAAAQAAATGAFMPVNTAMPAALMQPRMEEFPGFDAFAVEEADDAAGPTPTEAAAASVPVTQTATSTSAPAVSIASSSKESTSAARPPASSNGSNAAAVNTASDNTTHAGMPTSISSLNSSSHSSSIAYTTTGSTSIAAATSNNDTASNALVGHADPPTSPNISTPSASVSVTASQPVVEVLPSHAAAATAATAPAAAVPAAATPAVSPAAASAAPAPTSVEEVLAQGPTDAALMQAMQMLAPAGPTADTLEDLQEDLLAQYYALQLDEEEDEEEYEEEEEDQEQQEQAQAMTQSVVADAVMPPMQRNGARSSADAQRVASGQQASTSGSRQQDNGYQGQPQQQQREGRQWQQRQVVQDVWASSEAEHSSSNSRGQGSSSSGGSSSGAAQERMQRGLDALDEWLQKLASTSSDNSLNGNGSSNGFSATSSRSSANGSNGSNGSGMATPVDQLAQELGDLQAQMGSYLAQLDVQQLADMGLVSDQGTISREGGRELIGKLQGLVDNLKALQGQVRQVAALKGVELPTDLPRMSDKVRQALDADPRLNDNMPVANTSAQQQQGGSSSNGSPHMSSSIGSSTAAAPVVEVQPLQQPAVSVSGPEVASSSGRSNRATRSWGAWGGNERIRRANNTLVQPQEQASQSTSGSNSTSFSSSSTTSSLGSAASMPGYDVRPGERSSGRGSNSSSRASNSSRPSSAVFEKPDPGPVQTPDGATIVSKSVGKQRPRRVQRSAEERQATVASALKAAAEADAKGSDDAFDSASSSEGDSGAAQDMPGLLGGAAEGGKRQWWQERFQALHLPNIRYPDGSVGFVQMNMSLSPDKTDVRVITFEDRHDCMHCLAIIGAWSQFADAKLSMVMMPTHGLEQEIREAYLIRHAGSGSSAPAGIVVFRRGKLPMRVGMSLEEFTQVIVYQAAAQLSLSKIGYDFL